MKKQIKRRKMSKKEKKSLVYEIIGRITVRLLAYVVFEYAFIQFGLWAITRTTIY